MIRFSFAAALLSCLLIVSAEGRAATKTVPIEGLGHTDFLSEQSVCATTTTQCTVKFAAVPANKTLVVVGVSCLFEANHPSSLLAITLRDVALTAPRHFFQPPDPVRDANTGADQYAFDRQISMIVDPSERLELLITAQPAATFIAGGFCSLTGYTVAQ